MNTVLPSSNISKVKMPSLLSNSINSVNRLNNTSLLGSKMKVELQDNARRRKGGYT